MNDSAIKVYNYIDKTTRVHIVKAVTLYEGRYISAVAKCHPTDTFDLDFGTKVATTRLALKIAKKRKVNMCTVAKSCEEALKIIEDEKRRVRRTKEYADIAILDYKVEINKLEIELAKMLGK